MAAERELRHEWQRRAIGGGTVRYGWLQYVCRGRSRARGMLKEPGLRCAGELWGRMRWSAQARRGGMSLDVHVACVWEMLRVPLCAV